MLPLTKTNGPSPNQEKQPQTITLATPNFTIDTTHHVNTVRQASDGFTHVHLSVISSTVTHHFIKLSSTAPQSNDGVVYTSPSDGDGVTSGQ